MKKLLVGFSIIVLMTFGFVSSGLALTVSDVGGLDPLIAAASLSNSSEQSEADWISLVTGETITKEQVAAGKTAWSSAGYSLVTDGPDTSSPSDGTSDQWGFGLPDKNGYFLLKTGNGTYTDWLFKNDPSTLYGTFIIDYLYTGVMVGEFKPFLMDQSITFDINDITSISHFTPGLPGNGGGGGGGTPVPEPSTFILLGAGLAGLALYRRKKS